MSDLKAHHSWAKFLNILFLLVSVSVLGGCGLGADPTDAGLVGDSFAEAHRRDSGISRRIRSETVATFDQSTNTILISTQRERVRQITVTSNQSGSLLGILNVASNSFFGNGVDDDDRNSAFDSTSNFNVNSDDDDRNTAFPTTSNFNINSDDDDDDDDDRRSRALTLVLPIPFGQPVPACLTVQFARIDGRVSVDNRVRVRNVDGSCQTVNSGDVLEITRASWSIVDNRLSVRGVGAIPFAPVTIANAQTGEALGVVNARASGRFRLSVTNLFNPPCVISVSTGVSTVTSLVTGVTGACVGQGGNVPGATTVPEGQIIAPFGTSSTVSVGQSISFQATATDALTGAALPFARYLWNFDGAAANSEQQNPVVTFFTPGVYRINLRVWDSNNVADPTPATHVVIVTGNGTGSGLQPTVQISVPSLPEVNIVAGDTVTFFATGAVAAGQPNLPLAYVWDFGGGANNTSLQNPGPVRFNVPGTYYVSVVAIDSNNVSSVPATRVVNVLTNGSGVPAGNNQAPDGQILSPVPTLDAIQLQRGQTLNFSATGTDVDGHVPLTYSWDFGGAAPNSTLQNPVVQFNQAGVFVVMLTVRDSLGLVDPVPEFRVIAVTDGNCTSNCGGTVTPASVLRPNILQPTSDRTLVAGQSIDFAGSLLNPQSAIGDVVYMWDFDGAAHDTTAQNPGKIRFEKAGVYRVVLRARDASGSTSEVANRVVTVSGSTALPQRVTIASPTTAQMSIQLGGSVNFSGVDTANIPFTGTLPVDGISQGGYEWDFDGAAENSTLLSPGNVMFNQPGTYNVVFRARNRAGTSTPLERVTINVANAINTSVNQAPTARIVQPVTDMVVTAGSQVVFQGAGDDANNDSLTYSWNFGGSAPNSTLASPGVVSFNTPGVYHVDLSVTDSRGLQSPVHATRTITVLSQASSTSLVTISAQPNVTTITQGGSINFSAIVSNATNLSAYDFHWDLDGAANDRDGEATGLVRFDRPGTYRIRLRTITAQMSEAAMVERIITVTSNTTPSVSAPTVSLTAPTTLDQTLAVGEALPLSAFASDADNNYPLVQRWNFDGAVPSVVLEQASANTQSMTPGQVTFERAGQYTLRLNVTDSTGRAAQEITRVINVTDASNNTGNNNGGTTVPGILPVARIVAPNTSTQIRWGGSLRLEAAVDNAQSNVTYNYYWQLEGFGFDQAGRVVNTTVPLPPVDRRVTVQRLLKLTVIDSNGLRLDPVILEVTITQ